MQDRGHGRQRDDVVDDRRLTEQPLDRRQRWTDAHLAALAFEALQHGGLFTADVGACAQPHLQIEALAAAHDVAAEIARLVGGGDCTVESPVRMRVLGAQVDVSLRRADGNTRDGHALDQCQGIPFHQHAVREGAGVALIRIAGDEFLLRRLIQDRLPLDAGRECGAAPTAQAGIRDGLYDGFRAHGKSPAQTLVTVMDHVVRDADRIGDADARERQALLTCQPGDRRRGPERQGVRPPGQETGGEKSWNLRWRDGPVGHSPGRCSHLHHRLQPVQAAGPVANEPKLEAARRGLLADGVRDLGGPERQGTGVSRNVNRGGHCLRSRSEMRPSNRSGVTRPNSRPSIIAAGEQAQFPKQ